MITKLVLKNWRSHEKTELEFGKGTNVLVGIMGAGKSSVTDAMCFALFGTFPTLQSKKVKLDDVIMNKPEEKKEAEVQMTFLLGDDEFLVKRRIERGKGTTLSEVYKNGVLLEGPQNKRVTETITKILKINYELFTKAVYAEQNSMEYFLEIPKGQRKEKIDQLLNISKFEKARKTLRQVIKRLEDKIKEKRSVSVDEEVIAKLPELEEEVEKIKREINESIETIEKVKQEKKEAEKKVIEVEEAKRRYLKTKNLIENYLGKLEIINVKLSTIQKPVESEDEITKFLEIAESEIKQGKEVEEKKKKLEKEKAVVEEMLSKGIKKLEEIDEKLKSLSVIEGIEKIETELKKELEEIEKEIINKKAEKASLESKEKEAIEHIHTISGYEKCPVCDTKLTPEKKQEIAQNRKKLAEEIREKIREVEKTIEEFGSQKAKIREKLSKLEEEKNKALEKRLLEEEKEKIKVQNQEAERKLDEINKELKALPEKDVESLIKKCEDYKKKKEYYELVNQKEEIEKEIKKAEEEKEKTNYSEEVEKEIKNYFNELKAKQAVLEEKISGLEKIKQEKEKRISELKKIKEEVEKSKLEAQLLEKEVLNLHVLENALARLQNELRQEFTDTTNIALTDLWKRIYPYEDYLDLRLGIDDSGDYLLQVKTRNGKWVNVEGITSGGERSIACLALRIAFSLVLTQNLSWLVLDEPTHNLDQQAVKDLAEMLRDHLPKIVDQVFIITHDPLLEEAASAYLYLFERDKAKDEPTKVTCQKIS